jgi:hypothetical protein
MRNNILCVTESYVQFLPARLPPAPLNLWLILFSCILMHTSLPVVTETVMSEIHIPHTFFQLLFLSWADNGSIYTSSSRTCLENQTGLWLGTEFSAIFTYHATSHNIDSFILAEAEPLCHFSQFTAFICLVFLEANAFCCCNFEVSLYG